MLLKRGILATQCVRVTLFVGTVAQSNRTKTSTLGVRLH